MGKVWICLVLLSVGAAVAQDDEKLGQLDYWDQYFDEVLGDQVNDEQNFSSREGGESFQDYEDAIDDAIFEDTGKEKDDVVDLNSDYQIEDNRSAPKDDEEKEDLLPNIEKIGEDEKVSNDEESKAAVAEFSSEEIASDTDPLDITEVKKEDIEEKIVAVVPAIEEVVLNLDEKQENEKLEDDDVINNSQSAEISFDVNSDLEPLPLPPVGNIDEQSMKIFEETQKILNEDRGNNFDNDQVAMDDGSNIDEVVEQTQKLLDEIDNHSNVKDELGENAVNESDFDDIEDSVNMAYKDLTDDLDKLMETWNKLSMDDVKQENNPDDSFDVADYEEKNGRPYGEGVVLSQREDYYDGINDDTKDNDNSAIAANPVDEIDVNDKSSDDVVLNVNAEKLNDQADPQKLTDDTPEADTDDDKVLETPLPANDSDDKILPEAFSIEENIPENKVSDKLESSEIKDKETKDVKFDDAANDNIAENLKPIMYMQDAISPNEKEDTETSDSTDNDPPEKKVTTIDVSDLNPSQYNQLMEQFKLAHRDDLNVNSEDFGKNVAASHITLTLDEPVEITSPNYPNPYPPNNIIDWIFEGEGVGIEFNLTDFAINGVAGEYLLVKPGGVDESGHDGLVFSYRLDEPRRYRFLDVDRLFVRFASPTAWPSNFRGFKFSARMVAPLPQMDEIIPEPEAFLPAPKETHTLLLGLNGMNITDFRLMEESFRVLLADMATMYINANGIDMGLNTTFEVTQITGINVCHLSWPEAHRCAELTFGIPLLYEDDDQDDDSQYKLNRTELQTMWNTYSTQDPFATRLRRMDVTEFTPPNDRGMLIVWLLIGTGVLISAGLLAIALWRYTCFENYSRMPEFSDTGSEYKEKRGLDLYPTPHQTLPPLYDGDYRWPDGDDTTRVDMGGFTNRSFVRDQMYDIDSDEEVLPTRDRYTTDA